MLKQLIVGVLLASAALGAVENAAAQQTLNVNVGYFAVTGEDARVGADCSNCGREVDVLIANNDFLTFDIDEFNGFTIGAEWLVPLGQFAEAGAGLSFYRRTTPSVYTNYLAPDRSEVDQELRLRMLPIDLTLRIVPLGQRSPFQPYFGAGLTVIPWRYSEFGDFIDFSDGGRTIFSDEFVADGTSTGPVFLGGVRYADGGLSVGGELRYRKAEGDLPIDFAGSKIDLGGWTYQATVGFRFGR
jgi:hypothetical protein